MTSRSPRTLIGSTLSSSTTASRGTTTRLPAYFAISLVIATVLDFTAAVLSFVAGTDDSYGAATPIVSVFIRPSMLTLLLIATALVIAFLRGHVPDERASAEPSTARRSRRTPATVIAGWIAVVEGALFAAGVVVIALVIADASKHFNVSDTARLGAHTLAFAIHGVVVTAVPVWLGILVLRNRTWARYALIAYCAAAGVGVLPWPFLTRVPLIGLGLIAVAALLIWAELRERGRTGSIRNSWRGILLLVFNALMVVIYVRAKLSTGDPYDAFTLTLNTLTLTGYFVIALLLAMWAINRDKNDLWASLNASVVVLAPTVFSLVGFVVDAMRGDLAAI